MKTIKLGQLSSTVVDWVRRNWWTVPTVVVGGGGLMFLASSSPSFLGSITLGPQNSITEVATAYFDGGAQIPGDASTIVWAMLPPLAQYESVDISTKHYLVSNSGQSGSFGTARIQYYFSGTLNPLTDGGWQVQDPSGSAVPVTTQMQVGTDGHIAGSLVSLYTCGGFDGGSGYSLCLAETCSTACESTFNGRYTRDLYPYDASVVGLLPTITSINIDYGLAAGGDVRCATGTNFAIGATTVTVDSVSATIFGSTLSTQVCWVQPVSAVSATDGNSVVSVVAITTPGGTVNTTGTYPSVITYLPNYSAGWTGQNVTQVGGTITGVPDNGPTGFPLTAQGTAPTYTATGCGSGANLPCIIPAVGANNSLTNTSLPNTTVAWVHAENYTGTPGTAYSLIGSGTTNVIQVAQFSATSQIAEFSGTAIINGFSQPSTTFFWGLSFFSGAASYQTLNGGAQVGPANPGTNTATGVRWLGGSSTWAGKGVQAFAFTTVPTAQGQTNLKNYFTRKL